MKLGNARALFRNEKSAQIPVIAPELTSLSKIASDKTRPLEERLESFEIILDSEVGYTNLTRGRNIEREIELRQIYLKFEGGNPSGTQKDRIAFAQALDLIDGSLRNYWITDAVAQQYICDTVDCLVAYLETPIQKPLHLRPQKARGTLFFFC